MSRPLFIAVILTAILSTTPAAAVSKSGACEAVASVGYEAAQQRDAGVTLQDSLAVVADYGKATQYYAAAVHVAYESPRLTPEAIFYAVDRKCMGKKYVKRDYVSLAPSVPQGRPIVAADIVRMQAEIDAQMRKLQDDNAARWASAQAETLRQQQAEATRQRVEAAKREAEDKAKVERLDAEWAARDTRAAEQRAIQAEVPAKPTVWEILSMPSHRPYSTSCYTSSYGSKRYRSTYTRCY